MVSTSKTQGFTLVELAIVLVIVGLIVGGVLVGQDLIKAAGVRAAVTQLERYDSAANTFRGKYKELPGDLPNPTNFFASVTVTGAAGHADGNGLIEGNSAAATPCTTTACLGGENAIAFYELNQAGLVNEAITTSAAASYTLTPSDSTIPAFRLGKGSRVLVQSAVGRNYYIIANFGTSALVAGTATFTAGITPIDALGVDSKMDDGVPDSGKVLSIAIATALPGTAANGAAAAGMNATSCYDSTNHRYATVIMNANTNTDLMVCSLSVRTSF